MREEMQKQQQGGVINYKKAYKMAFFKKQIEKFVSFHVNLRRQE